MSFDRNLGVLGTMEILDFSELFYQELLCQCADGGRGQCLVTVGRG